MKNLIFYPVIVLLATIFTLSFNSCRKKTDTIADIAAYKGSLYGEGIIEIDEETENRATVFIQP